jgi:hypothetical protein
MFAFVFALALAGIAACRKAPSPQQAPSAPRGVGWTMPDDSPVRRGMLLSSPAGREDALVPVVAGGANAWVTACAGARDQATRARFSLDVPAAGGVTPKMTTVTGERLAPYELCLADRAAATLASANNTPRGTGLEITLDLR